MSSTPQTESPPECDRHAGSAEVGTAALRRDFQTPRGGPGRPSRAIYIDALNPGVRELERRRIRVSDEALVVQAALVGDAGLAFLGPGPSPRRHHQSPAATARFRKLFGQDQFRGGLGELREEQCPAGFGRALVASRRSPDDGAVGKFPGIPVASPSPTMTELADGTEPNCMTPKRPAPRLTLPQCSRRRATR